jgi:hypothetical protein
MSVIDNPKTPVYNAIVFVTDDLDTCLLWEAAIESYVIQTTRITSVYDFKDKLGQGTFGYVFLAEPKITEDTKVAIKILKK